jgi:ABC-2 type transport system permease protein
MNWKRVRSIAWWEYFRKVREKGFIASVVITPILMVGFSVLPTLLLMQDSDKTEVVGVVDQTGTIFPALKKSVEEGRKLTDGQPRYILVNYLARDETFEVALHRADSDALAEKVIGTFDIAEASGKITAKYRSPNPNNIQIVERFTKVIEQVVTQNRLLRDGIDTAAYNRARANVSIDLVKVKQAGKTESSEFMTSFFTAIGGTLLLMFLIMTTGQSLVRSLVEEKSNRVMDLLVSSTTPMEMMWGKLVGLSGLGVTQILAWAFIAIGISSIIAVPAGAFDSMKGLYSAVPIVMGYIIVGYIFYSAIFIGVGSLVTTEQEAQLATSYLIMLLVVPLIFAMSVMQNPDSALVHYLSFIPFMTPSMMMIRIVTKMPSPTEIAATFATLIASTLFMVWAASRIFRTAILLYGKRPSFGEIVRWVRG